AALRTLRQIPQLNVSRFDPSVPPEVRKQAVDFKRLAAEGGVLYLRVRDQHALVPLIVLALYETIRRANSGSDKHTRCLLIADEMHRALPYSPTIFADLKAISRSCSLTPVFLLQTASQIVSAGGEELLRDLLDIPVAVFFGSGDPTTMAILKEWSIERFESSQDGRLTYLRYPALRETVLQWTAHNAAGGGIVRRTAHAGSYTTFAARAAVDPQTYRELREKGWPKPGELEGALLAESAPILRERDRALDKL